MVTIGILFALKDGYFRAFYCWLKRDYNQLFGSLPDRSVLLRLQQQHTDLLMAQPGVLKVVDIFPIELKFPSAKGARRNNSEPRARIKAAGVLA